MTKAILRLEGQERVEGEAEIGGDFVRLLVADPADIAAFETPARGEIEFDGMTSDVALESAAPAPGEQKGMLLTMRLFKPVG